LVELAADTVGDQGLPDPAAQRLEGLLRQVDAGRDLLGADREIDQFPVQSCTLLVQGDRDLPDVLVEVAWAEVAEALQGSNKLELGCPQGPGKVDLAVI